MPVSTQLNIPSFIKAALTGSRPIQLTFADVADTNIQSTSSFMYDVANAPLKSTQQLNVDWSKFENHTFFSSAEATVNFAFDKIINGYPFDGTRQEVESFFESMTGFERWVFDQFPTYKGELLFSGTQVGETSGGTFIDVKDVAGGLYPQLSKNTSGMSVLNPHGKSLSVEMQLFVPAQANDVQVVFQKISGSLQGATLYLSQSSSTSSVEARFGVAYGSLRDLEVPFLLKKGVFNHLCVELNRETSVNFLEAYVDSVSVARSKKSAVVSDMDIDGADFLIGSGSSFTLSTGIVTPKQTLSGVIDELRVFHSARTSGQQGNYAGKSLFATPDLKLYYRFNEPPPPIASTMQDPVNSTVLDSSGNSLHSLISNFTGSLRLDTSQDTFSNVVFEKKETLPVLFPAYAPIVALSTDLLVSGTAYDAENPNLITRLIPLHYLQEGSLQDNLSDTSSMDSNGGTGIPGEGTVGNVQVMLSLLYIWAKFFDEMKLYVDAFGKLRTVDYSNIDVVPNNFVLDLINQYGFHLPPAFNDSTLEQYVRAENIDLDVFGSSDMPLKIVQHELLKRVLINMPDVIKSKGTQNSIKAFLRAVGIDPDNSIRVREYGGPTNRQLEFAREKKKMVGALVNFVTSSFVASQYLTAPRVEPGIPERGSLFDISHNAASDTLLTSGSFTFEANVKFTPDSMKRMLNGAQSIVRMCTTGSASTNENVIVNFLAINSDTPNLTLYVRTGDDPLSSMFTLNLQLPGAGVFDGERWSVSFGRTRGDFLNTPLSSSYFLRAGRQNDGDIDCYVTTSSFFYENNAGSNMLTTIRRSMNASGSRLVFGNNQNIVTGGRFLNDSTLSSDVRQKDFEGALSDVRFWSKSFTDDEWREHIRNFKSLGVFDPHINYNFNHADSGSWERIRLDTFQKQITRNADSLGNILFNDFSLNKNFVVGTGFQPNAKVITGDIVNYSMISPYFDEAATSDKIRIRGFSDPELLKQTPWAGPAPVNEIVKSEMPTDDVRFSIEFSLVDALNRDIVTMFSTLDEIANAIGSPEVQFSSDYPSLSAMANTYFNRLQNKLNFKAFFEFFKFFDASIGMFVEQLIPRKTKFKGTNFIIESHLLERHKLEYKYTDMYLSEDTKAHVEDNLLLQLIAGSVKKY